MDEKINANLSKREQSPSPNAAIIEWLKNEGILREEFQDTPVSHVNSNVQGFFIPRIRPLDNNQAPVSANPGESYTILDIGRPQQDYLLLDLGNDEELNKIQEVVVPKLADKIQALTALHFPSQEPSNKECDLGILESWNASNISEIFDIESPENQSQIQEILMPLETYEAPETESLLSVFDFASFEPLEPTEVGPPAQTVTTSSQSLTTEILIPLGTYQVHGVGDHVYNIAPYELSEPALTKGDIPALVAGTRPESGQRCSVIHKCVSGAQVPPDIIEAVQQRAGLEPSMPPPAVLAMATFPGSSFDPRTEPFTENSFKRREFHGKRKHDTVPEEKKDEEYWKKRERNTEATRRSRETNQVKVNQLTLRVAFLEEEHLLLAKRLELERATNAALKEERERLFQAIPE